MPDDLLTTIRAEIDARLGELRPLLDEYQELSGAIDALGDGPSERSSSRKAAHPATRSRRSRVSRGSRPRGRRPSIDAGGEAILAALEHGSHTVAELGVVTARPAPEIRESLRRLLANEAIVKTEREARAAYALPAPAA